MTKQHKITHLIHLDPKQAKDLILDALRKEKMHKGNAAARLECRHGTLLDWIKRLELGTAVEKLEEQAKKEGWFHEGHRQSTGRPQGTSGPEYQAEFPRFAKSVDDAKEKILKAVTRANGDKERAAKRLKISKKTLGEWITRYSLDRQVERMAKSA